MVLPMCHLSRYANPQIVFRRSCESRMVLFLNVFGDEMSYNKFGKKLDEHSVSKVHLNNYFYLKSQQVSKPLKPFTENLHFFTFLLLNLYF